METPDVLPLSETVYALAMKSDTMPLSMDVCAWRRALEYLPGQLGELFRDLEFALSNVGEVTVALRVVGAMSA